jgi:hypothetical protein
VFNIALVSLSVTITVLILKLHFRGHRLARVPNWIMKLFLIKSKCSYKSMKRLTRTYSTTSEYDEDENKLAQKNVTNHLEYKKRKNKSNSLDRKSSKINTSSVSICETKLYPLKHGHLYSYESEIDNYIEECSSTLDGDGEKLSAPKSKSRSHQSSLKSDEKYRSELQKIFELVRHSTRSFDKIRMRKKNVQSIYDEWKEIAHRCDFLLFIIASTVIISAPIMLFGKFIINRDVNIQTENHKCGCSFN